MTKTVIPPVEFEPEFIAGVKTIFEEKIVFNHVLGLKVVSPARNSGSNTMAAAEADETDINTLEAAAGYPPSSLCIR